MEQTTVKTADAGADGAPSLPPSRTPRTIAGENAVIWTLWLTYGAFYFCRTNISVAAPGMKASLADGGLAFSGEQVGWILAASKIAYGLGQLLNGQLSERIPPRVMLAIGMFGSAALNVLFGLSAGFWFLLFVWATNGFCQSLGWTPCMRVAANWVPIERRGHAIGIIGTGYQITLGLTYVIAGQAATLEFWGWRGALYAPAILLALAGVFTLVCLRESPAVAEVGSLATGSGSKSPPAIPRLPLTECLYWTLYNPTLWLMGLSLGLLNACRFGFVDWGVTHLLETKPSGIDAATLKFFVIAIGAAVGSYLAGWATDRFFGSRRAPVICVLMALLGALSLFYDAAVRTSPTVTMLLLVVIGFCIFGPQVLLVGTAPADLAHRRTSAAAAGFVDFMGYMGAAIGDVVTGYYSAKEHGGWQVAIYIWAGWAFAGSLIAALLWNTTARKIGLMPSTVPKVASAVLLTAAGAAAAWGHQPAALQLATFAGAVLLLGTFLSRWSAMPGLIIAAGGLITVFSSYARMNAGVTWHQAAAMVAYGLTMIMTLMILVERKGEACASS